MFQGLNKKPDLPSNAKLEGFSEREAIVLFQTGKVRRLEEGEYLIRKGEDIGELILVLDGSFKIHIEGNHNKIVAAKCLKGSWFGNPDIAGNGENQFSVVSTGTSRVMEVDRYAFNLLSPEMQMSVCRKIIDTTTRITNELINKTEVLSKKVSSLVSYTKASRDGGKDQYAQSVIVQDMIKNFPRLPIQINKLTSMLLDEGASVSAIVGFAKMDPSIVSVVLKTVNSGFYNFQRKISDFHHAFVLLGFNQVYQILMENFLQGVMPKHFNLKELNLHSAVISQIAFDIAQLSKKSTPVMMSTLGILHDLGKCVVLVSKAKRPELDLILTRLDDSKIGSLLLDTWNTPGIICQSVEYQQYPEFCQPEKLPDDCRESVAILHIAHICFDCLSGMVGEESKYLFSEEYLDILGLNKYSIKNLVSQHVLPSLIRKIEVFPDYVRSFISNSQHAEQFLPAVGKS